MDYAGPDRGSMTRFFFLTLLCGLLTAQQPPSSQTGTTMPHINSTVQNVIAPVWEHDAEGNYVNGLRSDHEALKPISMVILLQGNSTMEPMLLTVSTMGNLIGPMIVGDRDEARVVACDARLGTLQEFTSNPDKIIVAVYPGSTANRMVDAYEEAARMLCSRLPKRRRIILMIGDKYDIGSETRWRDTLSNMQLANVTVYAVDMSWLLNAPTPDVRLDTRQTTTVPMPFSMPATPTTVMQTYGTEGDSATFLPLLLKIDKGAKSIFK